MKYIVTGLLVASSLLLSGCESEKIKLLESPCAGIDGSPCGPKRSVNDWWLHHSPQPPQA